MIWEEAEINNEINNYAAYPMLPYATPMIQLQQMFWEDAGDIYVSIATSTPSLGYGGQSGGRPRQ